MFSRQLIPPRNSGPDATPRGTMGPAVPLEVEDLASREGLRIRTCEDVFDWEDDRYIVDTLGIRFASDAKAASEKPSKGLVVVMGDGTRNPTMSCTVRGVVEMHEFPIRYRGAECFVRATCCWPVVASDRT